ncbi:MAG: hypothetical protein ACT4OS_03005 [Acidimicrobiales bacterium]
MAVHPSPELMLTSSEGRTLSLRAWLTTFHLLLVAVDPTNPKSTWILPTAGRILADYDQSDCRVAWLLAGDASDAKRFLGRRGQDILTFLDPDLVAIKGFGLQSLPALVHVGMNCQLVNAVEGWDPPAWRAITVELSRIVGWSRPLVPGPKDPGAFLGAPIPAR